MKTIIYTNFDCIVKKDDLEYFISANKNLTIENIANTVQVYPTGKSKIIPFTINFFELSPFYRIIEKDGKRLIFLIDGLYMQKVDVHHFLYNGRSSKIEISNKEICFSCKETKKIISLPQACENFKCGSEYHINYVIFSSSSGQNLVAFNTLNGLVKTFEGQNIEIKNKDIIIIKSDEQKDILYIDKEGLKIKEHSVEKQTFFNPLYIAKNFMEKIKRGEFASALNYLSPTLQQNQTQKSLQEYFGEVSFIFPIDIHSIFALSNGNEKIYTFEIDNGKIVDICD